MTALVDNPPAANYVEDFRRRVEWGQVSARAADALSPTGNHVADWDPHRIRFEPLVQKAKPGATIKAVLIAVNPLATVEKISVTREGRELFPDQSWQLEVPAQGSIRREVSFRLPDMASGRHVFPCRIVRGGGLDPADAFVAVDVE